MIRLGVCTTGLHSPALAAAGFDYVEENFTRLATQSDGEYAAVRDAVLSSGIRAEAANSFIAKDFPLLTEEYDPAALEAFLTRGFSRFVELGGRVVVFGSGAARHRPDGMSREEGLARVSKFASYAADFAERYGVRIAIEPLSFKECNYVNFVNDAFEITRRAGFHPALGAHADLYHMAAVGDDVDNMTHAACKLYHTHLAEPDSRVMPKHGEHDALYRRFFRALHAIGYHGRVSFEGGGFAPEHAAELYRVLDDFR